jgi:hypothetical protein
MYFKVKWAHFELACFGSIGLKHLGLRTDFNNTPRLRRIKYNPPVNYLPELYSFDYGIQCRFGILNAFLKA